jgi:hypothetical protein
MILNFVYNLTELFEGTGMVSVKMLINVHHKSLYFKRCHLQVVRLHARNQSKQNCQHTQEMNAVSSITCGTSYRGRAKCLSNGYKYYLLQTLQQLRKYSLLI